MSVSPANLVPFLPGHVFLTAFVKELIQERLGDMGVYSLWPDNAGPPKTIFGMRPGGG